MNHEVEMCTALKLKNLIEITSDEPGNCLERAVEEFKGEVVEQVITGIKQNESHGVFYMYKDGSIACLFSNGITISDPAMVLHAFVSVALKQYEEDNGGADRIRHDG